METVVLLGTLDTKGPESEYVREHLAPSGLRAHAFYRGIADGGHGREHCASAWPTPPLSRRLLSNQPELTATNIVGVVQE